MKWLSLFLILPTASLAFQYVAKPIRSHIRVSSLPQNFQRAEQCATHAGQCSVEEMEELASELEQFQQDEVEKRHMQQFQVLEVDEVPAEDYKDTKMVADMLRAQSELNAKIEDYVEKHHENEHTFDMSDV